MKSTNLHPVHYLLVLLCCTINVQCSIGQNLSKAEPMSTKDVSSVSEFKLPYTINEPESVYTLPKKLVEISGLGLSANGQHLVAVQDEDGIVFLIDKTNGEVVQEIPFGKSGDYEGLEQVGDDIYVIKSSGKIYAIKNAGQETPAITKYKTQLTKDFDVEGLSYHAQSNSLLIACKGQPDALEKEMQFAKAFYHFQLDSMVFDSIPAMVIDKSDILAYFQNHPPLLKTKKDGSIEEISGEKLECHPSAIAIHPMTGNYYVSSSKGKTLFIISPDGALIHIEKLRKKILPQPEGMVFDTDGTLFIANEGGEEKAIICRYSYKK